MRIVAVIPAYNEGGAIRNTLESLTRQTHQCSEIWVVANNCTDNTAEVASQVPGVKVVNMPHNPHKKAGALNLALEQIMPTLGDEDAVLVMDADTTISADFVQVAARELRAHDDIGGISSIFLGKSSRSLLGNMQRMEYFRQEREIRRRAGEAFVMSGTASIFRVKALKEIRTERQRGVRLPKGESYYDLYSLTEDNELTFALKTLDYACIAPGIVSETDVMETSGKLVDQRRRWYLGALRNLGQYGLMLPWHLRWTYWRQQAGLFLSVGVVSMMLILAALYAISIATGASLHYSWLWTMPTVILLAERTMTVWKMGWKERILAALLVPEILYSYILLFSFAMAAKDWARGHQGTWQAT